MKIFVVLPRIPYPLEKGDKLRAFNQIKQLAKNNEIVLCALNDDPKIDEQLAFKALQPYCVSINFIRVSKVMILFGLIKAFFKGIPFQCGYYYNRRSAAKIDQLIMLHRPDMLFGQLLRVAEYIRYSNVPKTIDYQDVFSMGMKRRADIASPFLRPIFMMEYHRLQRYEHAIFDDFDIKTIISEPDRSLIPHADKDKILIIPNGVDHEYYKPQKRVKKYDLVFTGNMGYAPNVNAVEYLANEILPKVWEKLPNVKMYIAGASPDPRVKKVACDNIIISGWLDDIRDAYAQSKVFIAPMRIGTGLQNKLLEAMSMKLPCITTPLANNSLCARDGKEILVGSFSYELAADIIMLLTDTQKADEMAQAGYDFVHRVYDWCSATHVMEKAMQEVLAKTKKNK
jgi:Glycosyltransferase